MTYDSTYQKAWRLRNPSKGREYTARWRERNPEKYSAGVLTRIHLSQRIIDEAKDVPCTDCGERFPSVCMDFDHVRGEKSSDVSRMLTYSPDRLREEMAKCEVVCANCHRIRTRDRR